MVDKNNENDAIEQKKETNKSAPGNSFTNIKDFLYALIHFIIVLFIYFSCSGLMLYLCKLAQSNILPTDSNCYPYSNNMPNIAEIDTNIFTTLFSDPQMSMKLRFPYNETNASNKLLEAISSYRNDPKSIFLANYFTSIIESLVQFNYSFLNVVMNTFNGLPEIITVLLGPIITFVLLIVFGFVNFFYLIYLWFMKMTWFFKKNTASENDAQANWSDVSVLDPINFGIGFVLVIAFIIMFFLGFAVIGLIPIVIFLYCLLSCAFYNSTLNGKNAGISTVIKEIFLNYKLVIVGILCLKTIMLAFQKLGVVPGGFAILTVLLVYVGVISFDIFKPVEETGLTPVTSFDQAKKTCSRSTGGFMGQSGGGNLTKELKKLNKLFKK